MTKDILKMSNGANFCLVDLHIHTPLDKRFKCPKGIDPTTQEGKKDIAEAYIKEALKKGIKILGITEHNDVSWIDSIRDAAKEKDITIFPGVELSADSGSKGIHIIALFEPETKTRFLDDLITQLGLPRDDRFHSDGSPKLADRQLSDLVDFITKNEGICIAAHVSSDHGILKQESLKGQPRVNAWTNQKLLAAEIPTQRSRLCDFEKDVFENTKDIYKRKRPIAAIYSSDARSLDEIGSRATWIKISSKTLEGLKQAFLDWESRIRHPEDFTPQKFSKILSVEWQGGFLDGMKIRLNDNLNCLIGGKGTGKSTILETLRFAFGDSFAPSAEKAREQHQEILREVFKKGSKIIVNIEAHEPTPKKYIIERIYNAPPVIKDEHGTFLPDLSPAYVIAIESYGQKEIYEISRDARFQLSLIDRFLGNKLDKLLDEEKDIKVQIQDNAIECLKLKSEADRLDEQIGRLPKLEEQFKRYKQSGISEKVEEKSKYEKEQLLISRIEEAIKKADIKIRKLKTDELLVDSLPDKSKLETLPNKDLLVQIKQSFKDTQSAIKKSMEKIEESISSVNTSVTGEDGIIAKWRKKYTEQEKRYQELLRKLQKEFPDIDVENFIETEKEIERLKPLKVTKEEKEKQLKEIMNQRKELLTKLYESWREQFSIRDKTCKKINVELEGILLISVEYEGNKGLFLERIKEFKSGSHQLEKITESSKFSIPTFIDAIQQGIEKFAEIFGITQNSASKLCSAIKEKDLLELQSFKVDTKTTIELNIGTREKPKYQNIKKLSVGQKCTAILTLILMESSNPLIIDQPEDDLDNTFIFTDIVKKLRKEKEKRQFITATHNANIPVLGDAELICVLTADADHGFIEKGNYGSIDDKAVKQPVEKILEGGREAFQLRKEKYGF